MNRAVQTAIVVTASLLIFGCGANTSRNSDDFGSMRVNNEITRLYESYTIQPDHEYYYFGRESQPDAILAVQKGYSVQSKYWKPVQLTSEQLENWVIWGKRAQDDKCASRRYGRGYQGADIFDPDGKIIGNWYSKRDWGVFTFPGDNTIIPYPPKNREGWGSGICT